MRQERRSYRRAPARASACASWPRIVTHHTSTELLGTRVNKNSRNVELAVNAEKINRGSLWSRTCLPLPASSSWRWSSDFRAPSCCAQGEQLSSLTAEETGKMTQLCVSNLRLWENIHYQYRNGVFDEDELAAERNSWKALGERNPLLRSVYCQLKQGGSLSPAFVTEMDKLAYGAPGVVRRSSSQPRGQVLRSPELRAEPIWARPPRGACRSWRLRACSPTA